MDVSEEKVCFVGDEEIDMALSYEELKPYLYSGDAEETEKSVAIRGYKYTAQTPAPAVIHVSMEKDGEIYTGILAFSHGEKVRVEFLSDYRKTMSNKRRNRERIVKDCRLTRKNADYIM